MRMNDDQLVLLAKDGHPEALGELYETYVDAIYRYCLWKVNGKQAEAEDLVHDIFIEVAKSIRSFNNQSSFKNWLYGIAKIKILNWVKNKYKILKEPLYDDVIDTPDFIDPDAQANAVNKVSVCLAKLDEREQKIVKLRYLKNYTVKEVSKKLSLTESNVKVLCHRALKKMKELCE